MARLRLIRRWSLMRNTQPENDAEHSLQVAMIAHAIAVTARDRYHRDVDPEHVVTLAVYHDATEVLTGDLPTPVKYHSEALRGTRTAPWRTSRGGAPGADAAGGRCAKRSAPLSRGGHAGRGAW